MSLIGKRSQDTIRDKLSDGRAPLLLPKFPKTNKSSSSTPRVEIEQPLLRKASPTSPLRFLGNLTEIQRETLEFVERKYKDSKRGLCKGAIIGLDMGCGKSVVALHFVMQRMVEYFAAPPGSRTFPRTLIICPCPLVPNWEQEISRWFEGYSYFAGDKRSVRSKDLSEYHIVITTYTRLSTEVEYRATRGISSNLLKPEQFEICVLDECQTIKNRDTQIGKAVGKLEGVAFFLPMSGTIIENKLDDVYVALGLVGASGVPEHGKSRSASTDHQIQYCRGKLPEVMFRRKANNPHKISYFDIPVYMGLEASQEYENTINSRRQDLSEPGDRKIYLEIITRLRGVLSGGQNSLREIYTDENYARLEKHSIDVVTENARASFSLGAKFKGTPTPKMLKLEEIYRYYSARGYKKMVVFSEFNQTLRAARDYFNTVVFAGDATKGYALALFGEVPQSSRFHMINEFCNLDSKLDILFMNIRIGASGFNLTTCGVMVIVEPHYNPQIDSQSTGRINRKGQMHSQIQVIRLISTYSSAHVPGVLLKTVEHQICERGASKRVIADGVVDGAHGTGRIRAACDSMSNKIGKTQLVKTSIRSPSKPNESWAATITLKTHEPCTDPDEWEQWKDAQKQLKRFVRLRKENETKQTGLGVFALSEYQLSRLQIIPAGALLYSLDIAESFPLLFLSRFFDETYFVSVHSLLIFVYTVIKLSAFVTRSSQYDATKTGVLRDCNRYWESPVEFDELTLRFREAYEELSDPKSKNCNMFFDKWELQVKVSFATSPIHLASLPQLETNYVNSATGIRWDVETHVAFFGRGIIAKNCSSISDDYPAKLISRGDVSYVCTMPMSTETLLELCSRNISNSSLLGSTREIPMPKELSRLDTELERILVTESKEIGSRFSSPFWLAFGMSSVAWTNRYYSDNLRSTQTNLLRDYHILPRVVSDITRYNSIISELALQHTHSGEMFSGSNATGFTNNEILGPHSLGSYGSTGRATEDMNQYLDHELDAPRKSHLSCRHNIYHEANRRMGLFASEESDFILYSVNVHGCPWGGGYFNVIAGSDGCPHQLLAKVILEFIKIHLLRVMSRAMLTSDGSFSICPSGASEFSVRFEGTGWGETYLRAMTIVREKMSTLQVQLSQKTIDSLGKFRTPQRIFIRADIKPNEKQAVSRGVFQSNVITDIVEWSIENVTRLVAVTATTATTTTTQ